MGACHQFGRAAAVVDNRTSVPIITVQSLVALRLMVLRADHPYNHVICSISRGVNVSFTAVSGGAAECGVASVRESAVVVVALLLILLEAHQRRREFCVFSPFGAQTRAGVCDPGDNHTFYGWIWTVQRNCHIAVALIATETANSETSGKEIFAGPLPVSRRNIQGSKIMA